MAASPKSRRKISGPSPEEALVRDLIELLEAGSTPWRKPWDCHTGGVHINLLTGRAYRGSNCQATSKTEPEATRKLSHFSGHLEKRGIPSRQSSTKKRLTGAKGSTKLHIKMTGKGSGGFR
jgi:hypothetical protein